MVASRRVVIAVWIVPSAVFLAITWAVYATYRIDVSAEISAGARAEIMSALRTALTSSSATDNAPDNPASDQPAGHASLAHADLKRGLAHGGPVVVSVWQGGTVHARVQGSGATLAEAVTHAARALARDPGVRTLAEAERQAARIKVDIVVGRGPVAQFHALATSLGVHPGLEGLGVSLPGIEALLLPDELVRERLFGDTAPLGFAPDFRVGFDFEKADMLLARQTRLPPGHYGSRKRSYFRFRTHSFMEPPHPDPAAGEPGPPIVLARGMPPRPALTAANLRAAALAGGRYLVAQLDPRGRYVYTLDLVSGKTSDSGPQGPYSIPRHAGTTYFLAELYRLTGETFLREPIERAFLYLQELVVAGGCRGTLADGSEFACVVARGRTRTDLGSTALTVVALAEYHRATGDGRYDALARALTEWILYMQRADGSFAHLYDVRSQQKDPTTQLLYYSGEAALALARMHAITGDERYRDAAERALDRLIDWYDFFAGGYFYGEEHWTCIAAEAAYPAIKKQTYRTFCEGYAAFQRAQQVAADEYSDQPDYAGAYNLTPFLVPQNTPAGSRTEAVLSTYRLGNLMGEPDPAIREQILAALHYALGQQIGAYGAYFVPAGVDGAGAMPASPVDPVVRIDYVQHVCSAMIRAVEIIELPEG